MWRRIGAAFVALAGFLVLSSLLGDSGHSPAKILGMLVMFGIAAGILVAIVATWKWLTQLWAKKPKRMSDDRTAD